MKEAAMRPHCPAPYKAAMQSRVLRLSRAGRTCWHGSSSEVWQMVQMRGRQAVCRALP
ncbi:hypothetical protein HaLaN_28075, partial [Haematococcus lacustris]